MTQSCFQCAALACVIGLSLAAPAAAAGLRIGDKAPYRGWKIELADSGDILDFSGYGPQPGSAFSDVALYGTDSVVIVGKVITSRTRGRQGWVYLLSE